MKKNKKILIISLILIIVLILIILFVILNNIELLNKVGNTQILQEEINPFSYFVYDNKNQNQMKIFITVKSENGIDYVQFPDGNKLYGNGKNTLSLDYIVDSNTENTLKIKESNGSETDKKISIDQKKIEESVNIEEVYKITGYKTFEISKKIPFNNYDTYYKIGKDGEWVLGSGKISIADYDIIKSNKRNDNGKVTISAKVENKNNGNIVTISKEYDIDNIEEVTSEVTADSLLSAVRDYDSTTGKVSVQVSNEKYNLKIYTFKQDVTINGMTNLGTQEDVAKANSYAQNMIVLRVDGNLTIDKGITLAPFYTQYGGPKGFMIYVTGQLINNGTIDNSHGAKALGQNVYLCKNQNGEYEIVPKEGGYGASAGGSIDPGRNGGAGANRQTGGGGSGALASHGTGSAGTSYSGGTGGGACSWGWETAATSNGGAGGRGNHGDYHGGGGAGNPGGAAGDIYATKGQDGTGGLLIIYCGQYENSGKITANGKLGGTGSCSGGSSGGGSINIFTGQRVTARGNITANGGGRLYSGTSSGGAGGNGTISIGTINIETGSNYESM